MCSVTAIEQRQLSGIRADELQPEDGAKAAEVGTCLRQQVRIAGRIKYELGEVRSRSKQTIFRSFERCGIGVLCQSVRIKRAGLRGTVMNRDPVRLKNVTVGVQ